MEAEDIDVDDNTFTGCYIFKPAAAEQDEEIDHRPKKKRRLNTSGGCETGIPEVHEDSTWPSLLGGQESTEARQLRQHLFRTIWGRQQHRIVAIADQVDHGFISDIFEYTSSDSPSRLHGRIKTGLITSPPGTNTQRRLLRSWRERELPDSSALLIELQPSHAPNLQTALKNVIKFALCQKEGVDVYTNFLAETKAMIPMNFDLELLQRYMEKRGISRIIVSILDIEAFDTGILSELISTFHSWSDRIPFVLLFGISTTVELFESRLPRSTISLLDARIFQPTSSAKQHDPLFEVYSAAQCEDPHLFLGPSTLNVLAELAQDQSTTVDSFARTIKYVFMSHFFANPLAALGVSSDEFKVPMLPSLAQAIRNTPGFKVHCESLAKGTAEERRRARDLIKSDAVLEEEVVEVVCSQKEDMGDNLRAIKFLQQLYQHLAGPTALPPLESQVQFLASLTRLTESEIHETMESSLEGISSIEQLKALITAVSTTMDNHNNSKTFPGDPDDSDNDMPMLAAFQKSLNSKMSEQALPQLLEYFIPLVREYLTGITTILSKASPPWTTFMSEAYTYNLKHPLSAIVNPRARYSLERALTKPADYLGCECCVATTHHGVLDKSSLPPTSLLLSMLNEAGTVINVRDLWDAFRDTVAPSLEEEQANGAKDAGEGEEETIEEATERKALALFYRSLAELRHLGLIKQSKRKPGVDCIAKTAWMGL
ncbi:origin recognition complex subunit 3 [Exophiala viscosa]|uniref:Origin recognition complex subunit 3 n=1 Tax=Exophiala viscosa TaxID=2486360 RepID=A0AAN6E882_9EURO|nr:origin recognition complex subunit 3 [Exophiala viscosa]KAI1627706.1 origin recognition complex subunit 3 [Exophiala viscosa]